MLCIFGIWLPYFTMEICVKCNQSYDEFYIEIADADKIFTKCEVYKIKERTFCWCFCLDAIHEWISNEDILPSNPITRTPLAPEIVEDIRRKYKLFHSGDLETEQEKEDIKDFAKLIVDTRTSMYEKFKVKVPLDKAADFSFKLYMDILELRGDEPDEKYLKSVMSRSLKSLRDQGRV